MAARPYTSNRYTEETSPMSSSRSRRCLGVETEAVTGAGRPGVRQDDHGAEHHDYRQDLALGAGLPGRSLEGGPCRLVS